MLAPIVAVGDRRASLEALRDRLARAIDECDRPVDVGALSKHLAEVLRELDAIPSVKAGSTLDDLSAKRASRGAATSGGERAAVGRERGGS